jgi:inosine-uridine nucleoside N-ribohydrolase
MMIDTIAAGPTTAFLMGTHTNFALFLMSNPHLKKNVERIYIMGGGVRSHNPTGCCPKSSISCVRQQCEDHGNMFTAYTKDPYAEFNIFGDPFAAYQVPCLHTAFSCNQILASESYLFIGLTGVSFWYSYHPCAS